MAHIPDHKSIADTIQKNRNFFVYYNIAHLRELIRYLSPEKYELFHTLPFLLHVNAPNFPGYVADPDCKYGIYGFQDSGFWKLALKHLRYSERELLPCLANKYHIRGLYLMGSSGTLAQGDHSDLDYWVLVDEEMNQGRHMDTLKQKLSRLEEWAEKTYTQQISFFILTTDQVKNNSFRQVDEESSGNIQPTILKEEFYRTFIMIAGLIPYWSIFPVGLDESQYRLWIDSIENHSPIPDQNYIDLGYPAFIDKKECEGALLWQVFKASHDPVKSYIKASLIVYYYFSPPKTTLPCDEIKKKFSDKQLDSYMVDPYSTIFNKTLSFYQNKKDTSRLELLRECLFLRIHGYPMVKTIDTDSPKDELLQIFLKQWSWDHEKITRFQNYPNWPEPDKLDYEVRIISRISTLYKEIEQSETTARKPESMDLRSIQNRISAIFKTKPDKIPRCSAYIKAKAEAGKLKLIFRYRKSENGTWTIYEQGAKDKNQFQRRLFAGSGLSHLMGWLDANHLHLAPLHSITVDPGDHYLSSRQAMTFLENAFQFLQVPPATLNYTDAGPAWCRILVAVDANPSKGEKNYENFDIIIKNTWGEILHHRRTLKNIENNMLKCYKLSQYLHTLTKNAPYNDLQYLILAVGAEDEQYAHKTTLEFIRQFREELPEKKITTTKPDTHSGTNGKKPERPLLDLL